MARITYEDVLTPIDRFLLEGIDTSMGPILRTKMVASIFFGRSPTWLRKYESKITVREFGEKRSYNLSQIEQLAHGLAENGIIDGGELRKVLRIVYSIALAWGFI